MRSKYPQTPFERYADDAIVHCWTEAEAQKVRAAIAVRMEECRLELHPEKTKVVYCKDGNKRRRYPHEKFDFLGYGFQPRRAKSRAGKYFVGFSPAISDEAGRRNGLRAFQGVIQSCSRTGKWARGVNGSKWEPDESRGSSPVLREPRGEIPRVHSPATAQTPPSRPSPAQCHN